MKGIRRNAEVGRGVQGVGCGRFSAGGRGIGDGEESRGGIDIEEKADGYGSLLGSGRNGMGVVSRHRAFPLGGSRA